MVQGPPVFLRGVKMTEVRVEATIESDGELHLRQLPCRKGDRVLAVVTIPSHAEDEQREAARQRYLSLARTSGFTSEASYPSRDDWHARD